MTPTKLLIGQILIVFAIVILGVWAATQWCAAMLGYQPQLGPPWLVVFGWPVYRPWQLFPWWYWYDAYAPQVFNKAGMLAGASGFMGCGAAIIGSFGWGSKAPDQIAALIPNLKVELLGPVMCKGVPKADTFAALDALADSIAAKHAALLATPAPAAAVA